MGTVIQHSTQLCLPRPSSPLSSSQLPSGVPRPPTWSPPTLTCPPPTPTPTASRTTSAWSTLLPTSSGTAPLPPAPTRWLCPMAGPRPSPTPLDWRDTWLRCHMMARHSTLSTLPLQSRPLPTRLLPLSSTMPLLSTMLPSSTTPLCTTPSTTPLCTTLPPSTTLPLFTTQLPLPSTSPPSSTPPLPQLPRPLLRRLAQASLLPPLPTLL